MTERPAEPQYDDESAATEDALTAAEAPPVPAATGSTTSYTTGTLEPGEVGPAVGKPEHEGPTQGEGPITDPIQADDPGE
jgi:hypothetical protein